MGKTLRDNLGGTQKFDSQKIDEERIRTILEKVSVALEKRGYNPTNQLVGYIISGDPTYITSTDNSRQLITQLDRDQIVEHLLRSFMKK